MHGKGTMMSYMTLVMIVHGPGSHVGSHIDNYIGP